MDPQHIAGSTLKRLGRGINIMTTALTQLTSEDFLGLASRRVGHVRLCGSVVEPLINWSTCPGSTRNFSSDADAIHVLRRSKFMRELKSAALAARAANLSAVINPMHRLYTLEVTRETLHWVWNAMLLEFDETNFPSERYVFELTNEPGNYHNHTVVGGSFVDFVPPILHRIQQLQPRRVTIVGGEMGRRLDRPSSSSSGGSSSGSGGGSKSGAYSSAAARAAASSSVLEFVNSGPALIRDATHIRRAAQRHAAVATFHFYKPRDFTTQGSAEITHPRQRWLGTENDVAELAEQFDGVARSVGASTPVYLGEFGVNIGHIPVEADGVAWLRAVRRLCEQRGFGWAAWTYFQSVKALTTASNARDRLRQWDCSPHLAALYGDDDRRSADAAAALRARGECPPRANRSNTAAAARGGASPRGPAEQLGPGRHLIATQHSPLPQHSLPAREWCDDRRPLYAQPQHKA